MQDDLKVGKAEWVAVVVCTSVYLLLILLGVTSKYMRTMEYGLLVMYFWICVSYIKKWRARQ